MGTFPIKYIKNQFIAHPDWEDAYKRHFDTATPENYIENAEKVFNANGYTFKFERMNNRKGSAMYCVGEAEVYHKGEWLYGLSCNDSDWLQTIIVDMICTGEERRGDERIDFTKFI